MNYTLKEFKELVFRELLKRMGKKFAFEAMKNYKEDFAEFFKKGLSIIATATAIIMGY